jgi:hypothetical protein
MQFAACSRFEKPFDDARFCPEGFASSQLLQSLYAALVPFDFFAARMGSNAISSRVPVALAIRLSVDKLGAAFPLSRRAIVD